MDQLTEVTLEFQTGPRGGVGLERLSQINPGGCSTTSALNLAVVGERTDTHGERTYTATGETWRFLIGLVSGLGFVSFLGWGGGSCSL